MRAAYLSQDRPDTHGERPRTGNGQPYWGDFKRLGRFLKKCPRLRSDLCGATDAKQYPSVSGQRPCWSRCHPKIYDRDVGCSEQYAQHTSFHRRKRVSRLGEGSTITVARSRTWSAGSGRIRLQVGKRNGEPNRTRKSEAHPNEVPMAARTSIAMSRLKVVHVPGKSNWADALTKSVPGVQMSAQRDGKIRLLIPDRVE